MAETVTCTIDGREITVPAGTRIIEAAEEVGIGIAHYCYHPALSAPAMCRMCLVEVEGAPKLQPACITAVADGQVVRTEGALARDAREGVLEFYLANHPLDCPICDKSGECKLQDYVHQEGRKRGRSVEAKRVLGEDFFGGLAGGIVYDGDRCIMCTRCVRFMREISQSDRLGVVQRGNKSVIDTFFEDGVGADPWAGNIVDICPVGALLSKDFLHKARVWDLDNTSSICPNCSQGCNIRIDSRDNLVARLRPRANPEVNSYWMCDEGRYGYEWMNRTDRVETPMLREDSGALAAHGWQSTILRLVERLQAERGARPLVIGSPFLSNEGSGLLVRLARALGDAELIYRSARASDEVVCPGFPKLARRRDLAANVQGLDLMGFQRVGDDDGRGGLPATKGRILVVMGDAMEDAPPDYGRDAALSIVLPHYTSPAAGNADFVLPITTFAEEHGTFTNHEGRVQRFRAALEPPPLARPAWQVFGVLLAGLDQGTAPADAAAAFLDLGEWCAPFANLSWDRIGALGAVIEPAAAGAR
jgi:NADH-quinone oxidoreductase subunit G